MTTTRFGDADLTQQLLALALGLTLTGPGGEALATVEVNGQQVWPDAGMTAAAYTAGGRRGTADFAQCAAGYPGPLHCPS